MGSASVTVLFEGRRKKQNGRPFLVAARFEKIRRLIQNRQLTPRVSLDTTGAQPQSGAPNWIVFLTKTRLN
jgi:hypothetical protein